jgi:hypothetical protein
MKRIVFKLKDEAADDHKANQEWKNYPVGTYPKLQNWVRFMGFVILPIGIGIGYWVGHSSIGLFAGVAACFVLVLVAHPLRCPQCRGSVMTREVEEENGFKRFFHDCPKCRISWRCEKKHWD